MKEDIKDLGGIVNKDVAFSKTKENMVYHSENFRITANDDGTFAVRTTIRGNVNVMDIPNTTAEWKITLENTDNFIAGYEYELILDGENTINDVAGVFSYSFTYENIPLFYQGLVTALNNAAASPSSFLYTSSASVSSDFTFISVTGPLTYLTVSSFLQVFPYTGELINDGDFATDPTGIWSWDPAWSWDAGNQEMDATTANVDILQQSGLALGYGQTYSLSFDITVSSGDMLVLLGYGDPNQTTTPLITSSGTYTFDLQYLAPAGFNTLTFVPGNNFTGSVDNVSLVVPDYTGFLNITLVKPIQTNLKIIGWTVLRDDMILITTNGDFNPDDPLTGPFTSYGQLWRLSYDKGGDYALTSNYTLTLLYNDQLNLTVYRPIANPGMIEARYENSNITPVYWTDNYNPPRRANVADPSLPTYDPGKLNLLPSLEMDPPSLVEIIQGGNLKIGVYQFAYRLKNINGAETKFSKPSKLIPIIDASEQTTYEAYYPRSVYDPLTGTTTNVPGATGENTGGDSNKSVRLRFSNLDTSYDTIEIISIYYADNFSVPEFFIVKLDAVPSSGTYDTIVDSSSNDIVVTLDEVTAFNTSILRCKTLATKAQTLFLANVKVEDQDIAFDARTYRFPANTTTTTIYNNGTPYLLDSSFNITEINGNPVVPYLVPEEHDAIQDYNSQAPDSQYNNLYLPNSTVLGGEGPSIKYVFVTEDMVLDEETGTRTMPFKNVSSATFSIPNINGGTIEQVSSFQDNKSPYLYDALVGYRRDEMERFGIVFFDEYDNPSYVKWMGDIRIPHQFMPDTVTLGNPRTMLTESNYTAVLPEGDINLPGGDKFISTIASTEVVGTTLNKVLNGNILGLRITIKNFDGIPSRFKKAGIVRVPKTDADKHIVGQGFLRPTYKNVEEPETDDWIFTGYFTLNGITNSAIVNANNNGVWPGYFTFVSPEFLFESSDSLDYITGDSLDIMGILRKDTLAGSGLLYGWLTGYSGVLDPDTGNGNNDDFYGILTKNYFLEETASTPNTIKNSVSQNPYPLYATQQIKNKFLQNGGYTTDFDSAYRVGSTIPQGSDPTRIIYNTTARNPNDGNWFPTTPSGTPVPNPKVFSHCNNALFLQLDNSFVDNFTPTNFLGDNFLQFDRMPYDTYSSVSTGTAAGMNGYLTNYRRIVNNQFGGNSFSSRSFSEYISTNCIIDISDTSSPITTKMFGGDTTVAVMDYMMQFVDQSVMAKSSGSVSVLLWMCMFPCETSVAVDLRRSYNNNVPPSRNVMVPNRSKPIGAYNENDPVWYPSDAHRPYVIDLAEYFKVDRVYNYSDKAYIKYYPKPYLNVPVTEYDCRIWKSDKKIDGALVDTWGVYKPAAFLDVESKYGPINNLVVFQNKLLYFQDRGFGQLQVNEQKLINSAADGADLVLGSSGILERYDYISTQTGTKHQFSMSVSDYSLIWFDTLARKIYKLGDGLKSVTDIRGYQAFVYENTKGEIQSYDNPYINKGVHATYDYRFNEFYMTFLSEDKNFTLVFSDMFDGFVGEYTHYPVVYINDKSNIFSVPYSTLASNIYVHNYGDYGKFYGNTYPSKVSYIVNPETSMEKVFTNMEITAESFKTVFGYEEPDFNDFFDTMRVYDNYQNTDYISTSLIAKKHKTIWDVKVPSDRVLDVTQSIFDTANLSPVRPALTRRLKDKWFMVEFIYNNADNNKFVVHMAKSLYMLNSR